MHVRTHPRNFMFIASLPFPSGATSGDTYLVSRFLRFVDVGVIARTFNISYSHSSEEQSESFTF